MYLLQPMSFFKTESKSELAWFYIRGCICKNIGGIFVRRYFKMMAVLSMSGKFKIFIFFTLHACTVKFFVQQYEFGYNAINN